MEICWNGKVKILYVIATMDIGGAQKQLIELVRRLNKGKYDPVVCCLTSGGPLEDDLRQERIRYFILRKRFKFDFSVILRLLRLIKKEKPDIIHTHMFTANSFGRAAGIIGQVPRIIVSEHGVDMWKNKFQLLIDRILLHWTDKVICVSNGVKNFYRQKIGLNDKKAFMIYNCVGEQCQWDRQNVDLRSKYGIQGTDRVIGTVSRLAVGKGIKYLLQAMAAIGKDYGNLKLLIVGDGSVKKELISEAGQLGIESRIIFAGFQKDIAQFLKAMEIFVLPSLSEGLPGTVLEAMSFGKPVVASNIPGVNEAVVDGETGILVEPGNSLSLASAIKKLLNDREKARMLGIAGRKRVMKCFGCERMVSEYEKVYDELAQKWGGIFKRPNNET